jgi:hypothetical protein
MATTAPTLGGSKAIVNIEQEIHVNHYSMMTSVMMVKMYLIAIDKTMK